MMPRRSGGVVGRNILGAGRMNWFRAVCGQNDILILQFKAENTSRLKSLAHLGYKWHMRIAVPMYRTISFTNIEATSLSAFCVHDGHTSPQVLLVIDLHWDRSLQPGKCGLEGFAEECLINDIQSNLAIPQYMSRILRWKVVDVNLWGIHLMGKLRKEKMVVLIKVYARLIVRLMSALIYQWNDFIYFISHP